MKAVIYKKYGPPEVLQHVQIEKPVPKDNEMLVKVYATTVTVADVRMRAFDVPRSFWIPARIALGITGPNRKILGAEFSGIIEAVGKDVEKFKPGDEVFAEKIKGSGAYTEYLCIPENALVAKKPTNISFEEAAAIPVGARTALHYLRKANIQPGQKVLVYGASGSVGTYAVQLAKYFGAHVTGLCSTINLDLVKSLGADEVIDYTRVKLSDRGEKYDVIFEAINKSSFSECIHSLKEYGIYMNITEPLPGFNMIRTMLNSNKKLILGQTAPEDVETLHFLSELIEEGKLKVVIDRNYTIDEIVEAHRYVDKGHKKGNVVIEVSTSESDVEIQRKNVVQKFNNTFLPFF